MTDLEKEIEELKKEIINLKAQNTKLKNKLGQVQAGSVLDSSDAQRYRQRAKELKKKYENACIQLEQAREENKRLKKQQKYFNNLGEKNVS